MVASTSINERQDQIEKRHCCGPAPHWWLKVLRMIVIVATGFQVTAKPLWNLNFNDINLYYNIAGKFMYPPCMT